MTFVSKQIEHEGTLFGLPSIPEGFRKYPERSYALMGAENLERHIASRVVEEYLDCVQIKAEQWLRQKIKDEGVTVLRSVLEGDIFSFVDKETDTGDEMERTASDSEEEESESDDD
jgi:hypothetical protein